MALYVEQLDTTLAGPQLLRQPLALRVRPFLLSWQRMDPGFRISVDGLAAEIKGAKLALQVALDFLPGGELPQVSAVLGLQPMELTAVKPILPAGVMAASTVEWLDRALLAGSLHGASVVLRGDLDDWPFLEGQGRFDAVTSFGAAEIDYTSGWPAARIDLAAVEFSNNQMRVEVPSANVLGNPVANAIVGIDDLAEQFVKLGLALGAHDPAYVDAFSGPEDWAAAAKEQAKPLAEIEKDALGIIEALDILERDGADARLSGLKRAATAALTRARMANGESYSFDEEARLLYGVTPPSYSIEEFDAARPVNRGVRRRKKETHEVLEISVENLFPRAVVILLAHITSSLAFARR